MKLWIGLGFWILLIILGAIGARQLPTEDRYAFERAQSEMWRRVMSTAPEFKIRFRRYAKLDPGDGVFWFHDGELQRVGEVIDVRRPEGGETLATVLIDSAKLEVLPGGHPRHSPQPKPVHGALRQATDSSANLGADPKRVGVVSPILVASGHC